VDTLSKSELRMLLSVMEGELEARDLVIEALRVRAFSGGGVPLTFLRGARAELLSLLLFKSLAFMVLDQVNVYSSLKTSALARLTN
jgi:hypothetical protein